MKYIVDGHKFNLEYDDLKGEYYRFCEMDDQDFKENILHAAHLACAISYLKNLGPEATVSDRAIVHELIHVATLDTTSYDFKRIRDLFKTVLKLA